jgi:hypothetical protein
MSTAAVAHFVRIAAGKRFNPHVTIGVGTERYLNKMLAEPFPSFTFSPAIIGQLYPATLLARLVTLELENRRGR